MQQDHRPDENWIPLETGFSQEEVDELARGKAMEKILGR